MKRLLMLLLLLTITTTLQAQWVSLLDSNFEKWLTTNYPTCMQGNPQMGYQMDITCSPIVSEIYVFMSG